MSSPTKYTRSGVREKYNQDNLNGAAAQIERSFRAWCKRRGIAEDEHAGYYATKRRQRKERDETDSL